jgi:Polysaccharide biosynthesis protein
LSRAPDGVTRARTPPPKQAVNRTSTDGNRSSVHLISTLRRLFKSTYLVSLGAGYAQTAVTMLVSLIQVPLFLSYLGREQFGVWVLAIQVSTWLQLLDGGMNGALSRFIIDYRRDPRGEELRSCLATGMRVLLVQGVLVFALAAALGLGAQALFGLSGKDAEPFSHIMLVLGVSGMLGFMNKVPQSWLYGCQRLDLANLVGLVMAPFELLLLVCFLSAGQGVMSLAWARLLMAGTALCITWWIAIRWVDFPWRLVRGRWDAPMFRLLAGFGGGMFLLTLGSLLLTMSQTTMAARHLGLAAAAVWAVAPKVFVMAQQLVSKLWDYRIPHLSALMADGLNDRIATEFMRIYRVIAWIGGATCGTLAATNPAFLDIWTRGVIHWEWWNNLLMAVTVNLFLLGRCFTDFVLHTKKVGWMPVLMCIEGLIFLTASSWLLPRYGLTGMLWAFLAANGLLRFPYALAAFRAYLGGSAPAGTAMLTVSLQGLLIGLATAGGLSLVYPLLRDCGSIWIFGVQAVIISAATGAFLLRRAPSLLSRH